jgi:hypothetical protein
MEKKWEIIVDEHDWADLVSRLPIYRASPGPEKYPCLVCPDSTSADIDYPHESRLLIDKAKVAYITRKRLMHREEVITEREKAKQQLKQGYFVTVQSEVNRDYFEELGFSTVPQRNTLNHPIGYLIKIPEVW